jgi:hypothetical protein
MKLVTKDVQNVSERAAAAMHSVTSYSTEYCDVLYSKTPCSRVSYGHFNSFIIK